MSLLKNAIYLSWNDVKARYRKSVLGPMWQTLGNLIAVIGFSVVWSSLLEQDLRTFVPSLAIGFIVWQLVAGAITESANTFSNESQIIRNVAMPLWFFVVRTIGRQVINFLHNIILIIGVVLYYKISVTQADVWVSFLGVLLTIANLTWMTFVLGVLGARFKDIEYAINSVIPILFFLSPVLFRPDRLTIKMEVIWMNPLSHFIEAIRAPILGDNVSTNTYLVLISMLALGGILSLWLYRTRAQRVAFWV
jgi:ABC-type polysaccharide/polyol phosphate export permease